MPASILEISSTSLMSSRRCWPAEWIFLQVALILVVAVVRGHFLQHFAVTDDGVERRAQLVAHVRQEIALGLVGRLGRFLFTAQIGRAPALGDIADVGDDAVHRRAIQHVVQRNFQRPDGAAGMLRVHFHLFGCAPGGRGTLNGFVQRQLALVVQEIAQRAGFGFGFHAEDPHDRRTGVFEASLPVDQRDDVGSVFDQRAIVQLALPEFFFGAAQRGFAGCDFAHHVAEGARQLAEFVTASGHAIQLVRGFVALLAHVLGCQRQTRTGSVSRRATIQTTSTKRKTARPATATVLTASWLAEPVISISGMLIATFQPVSGALAQ